MKNPAATSRRAWLRSAARTALALGLGGGVGALVLREPGACTDADLCRGCSALARCDLPLAERVRAALAKKEEPDDAR